MIKDTKSCESDFMSWLSAKVSPAQLSELYWCYAEIESACANARIISGPLFETTDTETIRSVQRFLEQNTMFRARHLRQFTRLVSAGRYYLTYLTEKTPQKVKSTTRQEVQTTPQALEQAPLVKSASPSAADLSVQNTTPPAESTELSEKMPEPETFSVDFEKPGDYTCTKPYFFSYFEESREPCSSWTELYVTFFATLEEDYPHQFHSGMSFSLGGGRIELTTRAEKAQMFAPKPVPGTEYILETNISAVDIVRKMKFILDLCSVDYENVIIRYIRKIAIKENVGIALGQSERIQPRTSAVDRFSFYSYLLNVQKLAPTTCRGYISAIDTCERFAQEHHYKPSQLYTSDYAVAKTIIDELFCDSQFIEFNALRHNQLIAALKKFLAFISGNGSAEIGATAPNEPILPNSGTDPAVEAIESAGPEIDSGNAQKTSQAERSATSPASMQRCEAANPKQITMAEKIVRDADMCGITYDSLHNTLKLTMVATKDIVRQSIHIVEIKDRLYHEDAFIDWNDGAKHMCLIMEKLMRKNNGYISAAQLYDYARVEMNMFLNDNGMNNECAVYEIAQHLFEKNCFEGHCYTFTGKTHISTSEVTISSNFDIICKFAADQGGIFREDDLADYLAGLGIHTGNLRNQMRLNKEPVFFFYEPGTIISAKSMRINDSWKESVMRALNNLLNDADNHIVLRQIQPVWYESLPALPGHRRWTPLLLQFVLHFYGKEFGAKTIMAMESQSMDTLHAMLVKNDSPIQNFGDAVIAYLIESETEQRSFEAEELRRLLVKTGMIQGNELIWNMPKALAKDERFAWDAKGENVTVRV